MEERFIRTAMLIGEGGLAKLRRAHVAVLGVGGVGGYVTEALCRAGIGELTLIDGDCVSESNMNRQIIASLDTVGKRKVDAFRERIAAVAPDCRVNTVCEFILPEALDSLGLHRFDYIVDAIDTVSTKIALAELCEKENIPLISSLGTGNKLDPARLRVSDIYKTSVCPLARAMRTELKRRGVRRLKVVFSDEIPIKPDDTVRALLSDGGKMTVGSISFVPSAAGLLIASEVVRDILSCR